PASSAAQAAVGETANPDHRHQRCGDGRHRHRGNFANPAEERPERIAKTPRRGTAGLHPQPELVLEVGTGAGRLHGVVQLTLQSLELELFFWFAQLPSLYTASPRAVKARRYNILAA